MGRSLLSLLGSALLVALAEGRVLAEEAAQAAAPAEPVAQEVQQTLSVSYDLGIAATLLGIFLGVGMIISARLLPLYRDIAINLRTLAGEVEGNQPAGMGEDYEAVPKAAKALTMAGWIFIFMSIGRLGLGLAGWSF